LGVRALGLSLDCGSRRSFPLEAAPDGAKIECDRKFVRNGSNAGEERPGILAVPAVVQDWQLDLETIPRLFSSFLPITSNCVMHPGSQELFEKYYVHRFCVLAFVSVGCVAFRTRQTQQVGKRWSQDRIRPKVHEKR